jgi:eukaryotic-like serine/threonine-protein kinase
MTGAGLMLRAADLLPPDAPERFELAPILADALASSDQREAAANVTLREDGSAALADFGLAKGAAYTALTRPGEILGTLDYLAPELVRGGEATAASDVYALGCVAFECLAGKPPFADRSLLGVGTAHLEDQPPDPPAPPDVAWALLRALAKDPAARPASATMYSNLLRVAARG